jgi:hypothetical protein
MRRNVVKIVDYISHAYQSIAKETPRRQTFPRLYAIADARGPMGLADSLEVERRMQCVN